MKRPDDTSRLVAFASLPDSKGARIPSMADELATERNTPRARWSGSRRYGLVLESLSPMSQFYHQLRWQELPL